MKKISICLAVLVMFGCFCFSQETSSSNEKIVLSVESAAEMAMQNNLSIQRQNLSLEQLKKKSTYSWNSVSPSLSASGSYGINLENDTTNWSISGSARLNFTPSLFTSIKAAKLNYESGLTNFEDTKKTIEVNVRKAFFSLLLTKETLTLQNRNLETARQRYTSNRDKYKRGQLSELDMLNSQYAYESLKPAVESATINYENSVATFKQLLGIPQETELELKGELADYVPSKEIKVTYNPDDLPTVKKINAQIESAKNSLLATRFTAYAPAFNASYSYGKGASSMMPDQINTTQSISLGFSLPLDGYLPWTNGALNIDAQKANLKDLELQLDNEKVNAKISVDKAIKSIKQAQSQLDLLKTNVELAKKTYDMTLAAYNHGTRDLLVLKNASDALFSARTNLQTQMYTLISLELDLENTLGLPFGSLGK